MATTQTLFQRIIDAVQGFKGRVAELETSLGEAQQKNRKLTRDLEQAVRERDTWHGQHDVKVQELTSLRQEVDAIAVAVGIAVDKCEDG